MPRKKRDPKYKGKGNKHPLLEDYIDPDIVAEGYEGRTQRWKEINLEKKQEQEAWRNRIRLEKEKQMRGIIEYQQKLQLMNEKVDWVIRNTLTPEAYEWLDTVRQNDFECCNTIMKQIMDDDSLAGIDSIISTIYHSGGTPMDKRINLYDLVIVYRKIKHIRGKIMVQQSNGDMVELGDMVRESPDYRGEGEND